MFRGYDSGQYQRQAQSVRSGRQFQPKADPPLAETVRGHLSFERVRQAYKEIELLQKEMDEIKKGLGIEDKR